MVALSFAAHLKPKCLADFSFVLQQEIHPSLRKIKGFRGHIVLVLPNGKEAVAISLWNAEENEEAEEDATSKVVPSLERFIQGSPKIKVCDLLEEATDHLDLLQSLAGLVGESERLQILEVSRIVFQHFTIDTLV